MHDQLPEDLGAFARLRRTLSEEPPANSDPSDDALVAELMRPLDPARADEILDLVARSATTPTGEATVLQPRRSRLRVIVLPILAAIAAVFLLVNLVEHEMPMFAPMPASAADDLAYELAYLDAPGGTRGADDQATFSAGDSVVLRLRPRQHVREAVTAEVRAVQGTHEIPLGWRVDVVSDRGHLEIHGHADDLLNVASGEWRLEIKVVDASGLRPRWHGSALLRLTGQAGQR
jgi:hypothetical protein